jgi:ribose-phosphate pyrophosphokinase
MLVPLLLLGEELRVRNAAKLTLAAPYMPYMRQDSEFREGEVISARALGRLLSATWDEIITVDPHLHRIGHLNEVFSVPTQLVCAAPAIARWIGDHIEQPLLVGPDEESEQWVRHVAEKLGCPWYLLHKERRGDCDVSVEVPDAIASRERTAVFVDDIISTGHTLAEARRELEKRGVEANTAIGIHGIFAEGAEETLKEAGFEQIVTSNTIPHDTNRIDALAELALCFEGNGSS